VQDFYRLEEGVPPAMACEVANKAYYKFVADMNYEARILTIITYHASINVKVKKEQARNMTMTRNSSFRYIYNTNNIYFF